jgi:hypothetical protein
METKPIRRNKIVHALSILNLPKLFPKQSLCDFLNKLLEATLIGDGKRHWETFDHSHQLKLRVSRMGQEFYYNIKKSIIFESDLERLFYSEDEATLERRLPIFVPSED